MLKEIKMKIAARRVQRVKAKSKATRNMRTKNGRGAIKTAQKRESVWPRVSKWLRNAWQWIRGNVIKCANAIANAFRNVWAWIRGRNLVGMLNLTLLVAIITLFGILIVDITNCHNEKPIIIATEKVVPAKSVKPRAKPSLPIARDDKTNKFVAQPVSVVATPKCTVCEQQVAKRASVIYGDIVVDSRESATILNKGDEIRGNVYLQNMRKYTLPCDVKIDGNLFLRDLGMLQFCGDFTVTGNIYVSPRSSFGPIPGTARLGGQVIL